MEVHGSIWGYREVYGGIWRYIRVYGGVWEYGSMRLGEGDGVTGG